MKFTPSGLGFLCEETLNQLIDTFNLTHHSAQNLIGVKAETAGPCPNKLPCHPFSASSHEAGSTFEVGDIETFNLIPYLGHNSMGVVLRFFFNLLIICLKIFPAAFALRQEFRLIDAHLYIQDVYFK